MVASEVDPSPRSPLSPRLAALSTPSLLTYSDSHPSGCKSASGDEDTITESKSRTEGQTPRRFLRRGPCFHTLPCVRVNHPPQAGSDKPEGAFPDLSGLSFLWARAVSIPRQELPVDPGSGDAPLRFPRARGAPNLPKSASGMSRQNPLDISGGVLSRLQVVCRCLRRQTSFTADPVL